MTVLGKNKSSSFIDQTIYGSSLNEQMIHGRVKPAYVSGSAAAYHMQRDDRFHVRDLRENLIDKKREIEKLSTYDDAIRLISNQSNQYVVFGELLRLENFLLRNCNSTGADLDWNDILGIAAYTLPISLYVKDRALLSAINKCLLEMRQDRMVQQFRERWWRRVEADGPSCPSGLRDARYRALTLFDNLY